jgi:hypothetical protein
MGIGKRQQEVWAMRGNGILPLTSAKQRIRFKEMGISRRTSNRNRYVD